MNIEIHELESNSWEKLKKLRLQALNEFPDIFSESYSNAVVRPDDYWIELAESLVSPNYQRMFIAQNDNQLLGFVFALNDRKSGLIGRLGGMWVAKSAQRKGIGKLLCEKVIEWGKENNKERIQLWVEQTNSLAIKLYQRNSFSFTSKKWKNPDIENWVLIEMELNLL